MGFHNFIFKLCFFHWFCIKKSVKPLFESSKSGTFCPFFYILNFTIMSFVQSGWVWTSNTKFILKFLIAHHQKNFLKWYKNEVKMREKWVQMKIGTVKVFFSGFNRKSVKFCIDLPVEFLKSDNFLLSWGHF